MAQMTKAQRQERDAKDCELVKRFLALEKEMRALGIQTRSVDNGWSPLFMECFEQFNAALGTGELGNA